jgi:hypothetical protein
MVATGQPRSLVPSNRAMDCQSVAERYLRVRSRAALCSSNAGRWADLLEEDAGRADPGGEMATPLDQHEQFIRDRLEDPDSQKAEALQWLESSHGRNTLGELSSTQASIDLVKAIYAAGAEDVLAIEIGDYDDGHQNSGKLVIKLPTTKADRARIFDWHGKQAESMGFDAEQDIGQSHLFSMLD